MFHAILKFFIKQKSARFSCVAGLVISIEINSLWFSFPENCPSEFPCYPHKSLWDKRKSESQLLITDLANAARIFIFKYEIKTVLRAFWYHNLWHDSSTALEVDFRHHVFCGDIRLTAATFYFSLTIKLIRQQKKSVLHALFSISFFDFMSICPCKNIEHNSLANRFTHYDTFYFLCSFHHHIFEYNFGYQHWNLLCMNN